MNGAPLGPRGTRNAEGHGHQGPRSRPHGRCHPVAEPRELGGKKSENDCFSPTTTWTNLENMMLSGRSHIQNTIQDLTAVTRNLQSRRGDGEEAGGCQTLGRGFFPCGWKCSRTIVVTLNPVNILKIINLNTSNA